MTKTWSFVEPNDEMVLKCPECHKKLIPEHSVACRDEGWKVEALWCKNCCTRFKHSKQYVHGIVVLDTIHKFRGTNFKDVSLKCTVCGETNGPLKLDKLLGESKLICPECHKIQTQ